MNTLTRDGTAETVSRDRILRRGRGQGNIHFPCSADHAQDWQLYPVDTYSCYMCDYTHTPVTVVKQKTAMTYNQACSNGCLRGADFPGVGMISEIKHPPRYKKGQYFLGDVMKSI